MRTPIRAAVAALAAAIILPLVTASGCTESNDFEGRLKALDGAYTRGQQARERLTKVGLPIDTETACNDAWTSTGTRDEEELTRRTTDGKGKQVKDEAFQELRRPSFVNGCMGRPNQLTSAPPSAPSPKPSAS